MTKILIRTVIAAYLRECGYKVIEAVSADEAILVLTRPDIVVEIVFSDVEMPGSMDGFLGCRIGCAPTVRARCGAGRHPDEKRPIWRRNCAKTVPMLKKPYEPQVAVQHIRRLLAARKNLTYEVTIGRARPGRRLALFRHEQTLPRSPMAPRLRGSPHALPHGGAGRRTEPLCFSDV